MLSFPEGSVVIKPESTEPESTEPEYGLWDYFGSDFSFSMYTAKIQNKLEQGINDINWGAVDAGIGIIGGGFEIASGIALAPFTGGLSTALIIDGAYRVGMNGFRMGAYMTNNSKIGDALPGNLGGMAGKLIDGMNGSSFYETGMAQSSMALTNDLLLMCTPFATANSMASFITSPTAKNFIGLTTAYYSSTVGIYNNSKILQESYAK